MTRRGRLEWLFHPPAVAFVTGTAVAVQMLLLLTLIKPFDAAVHLVGQIAVPMLIANTAGAGFFMSILLDRRMSLERQSSVFSAKALEIAARAEGALRGGLDADSAIRVARIVYEETGVGAVAITDRQRLLAFIGVGGDHHRSGMQILSRQTLEAIEKNIVIYADGNEVAYQCSISRTDARPVRAWPAAAQIPCCRQNHIYLARVSEIEYVISRASGVFVIDGLAQERFTELTLKTLEQRTSLFRCHRQVLVNPDAIREIVFQSNGLAEIISLGGQKIPVSRRFLSALKYRLAIS
ncbi:5TMR of 5TMR-LYT [Cupriavidus sp. YR651]|uniref:LytTR family transcriptional regulator DNA-binding domain-containing protein n=1 Tax=Cupriavidus sp. YR651 TaxID=1855315 RepID=UPI000888C6E6|nr:LytTR family transcriptional regulator DNA-binding domain-containing protein [Cupriavidus sp. YR651]SDC46450.1 5TMR of 5TMR-LYT [Cupriavidus sp. YR651]